MNRPSDEDLRHEIVAERMGEQVDAILRCVRQLEIVVEHLSRMEKALDALGRALGAL